MLVAIHMTNGREGLKALIFAYLSISTLSVKLVGLGHAPMPGLVIFHILANDWCANSRKHASQICKQQKQKKKRISRFVEALNRDG